MAHKGTQITNTSKKCKVWSQNSGSVPIPDNHYPLGALCTRGTCDTVGNAVTWRLQQSRRACERLHACEKQANANHINSRHFPAQAHNTRKGHPTPTALCIRQDRNGIICPRSRLYPSTEEHTLNASGNPKILKGKFLTRGALEL